MWKSGFFQKLKLDLGLGLAFQGVKVLIFCGADGVRLVERDEKVHDFAKKFFRRTPLQTGHAVPAYFIGASSVLCKHMEKESFITT